MSDDIRPFDPMARFRIGGTARPVICGASPQAGRIAATDILRLMASVSEHFAAPDRVEPPFLPRLDYSGLTDDDIKGFAE